MLVRFFRRKPYSFGFSIEELFDTIQQELPDRVQFENATLPYPSSGIFNRFRNMRYAWLNRGQVNHITGDVHYLGIILPRRNTILTVHDCGELSKHKGIQKFFLWLFWFYWPVKRLRYITAISQATKNDLLYYVKTDATKIRVIHNCLIGNYLFKATPFNQHSPRILVIGITPNKNLERIAVALKDISCELVLLGEPPEDKRKYISNHVANFTIHNKLTRNEVSRLYSSCDILLFPSLIEGFGLPIIEAQASGIPVITSNISSMPEIAGGAACLVNPFDIQSIREGVEKIIGDPGYRENLIKKGLENVKRFNAKNIAKQYFNLYIEMETNKKELAKRKFAL